MAVHVHTELPASEKEAGGQGVQARLEPVVPSEDVLAAQTQVDPLATKLAAELQAQGAEPDESAPGGQEGHEVMPSEALYVFAAHGEHDEALVEAANVPTAHGVQTPPLRIEPAGQVHASVAPLPVDVKPGLQTHVAEPTSELEYMPSEAQVVQLAAFVVAEKVLAGHRLHVPPDTMPPVAHAAAGCGVCAMPFRMGCATSGRDQ